MCVRAVRLLAIRDFFETGATATAREWAERYGVSQRTVSRDLADLQAEPLYYPLTMNGWRYERMPRREDV